MFEKNTFCNGSTFVPRDGGVEEDDGWIITFVHNEDTNKSEVCLISSLNSCNYSCWKFEHLIINTFNN